VGETILETLIQRSFVIGEKVLLVIIALLTSVAVILELTELVTTQSVRLADLLLLFIYLEVFGMVVAYYRAHTLPVTLPVLIAITALTRLIILQGKDFDPSILLFEAGAIFLLAISFAVLTWANTKNQTTETIDR